MCGRSGGWLTLNFFLLFADAAKLAFSSVFLAPISASVSGNEVKKDINTEVKVHD